LYLKGLDSLSTILYEDESIIAINKPPKIPVHKTVDPNRQHLLQEYERNGKEVFLINRLDKDTSGVVLIAKKRHFVETFSKLFSEHKVEKIYFAIVEGEIDFDEKVVSNHLAPVKGLKNIYGSIKSGGKKSETRFKKISASKGFSFVKAFPKTGRTHQIRVHLTELGYPIAGDYNYGAPFRHHFKRVMLHSNTLSFIHPIKNERVTITAPRPEDFCNALDFLELPIT